MASGTRPGPTLAPQPCGSRPYNPMPKERPISGVSSVGTASERTERTVMRIPKSLTPMALVVLACTVLLPGGHSSAGSSPSHPIETTICDLVKYPSRFSGKLVRVRALVKSDGIEHTVLVDDSCKSQGVAPSVPKENSGHPDMEQLHHAIFRVGRPGTAGKRITGIFVGTYSWHRKKVPSRVLTLRNVQHLRVELDHDRTQ